jgi:hypothetical protein
MLVWVEGEILISRDAIRTPTPVASGDIWRHSTALSEFRTPFPNGRQRSVNRKVQSSNLCPGAKICVQVRLKHYKNWLARYEGFPAFVARHPPP